MKLKKCVKPPTPPGVTHCEKGQEWSWRQKKCIDEEAYMREINDTKIHGGAKPRDFYMFIIFIIAALFAFVALVCTIICCCCCASKDE